MRLEFRELQEQDSEQSRRQTVLAFASSGEDPSLRGNVALFGLFDGETLAAQSLLLQMDSFFGGAPVPTAGIGNVTVAPEYRGNGSASSILVETLHEARRRGAVLSTLFGGAPGLYRKLGYELIARSKLWSIPIHAFHGVRRTEEISLRQATIDDTPQVLALYQRVAAKATAMAARHELPLTSQQTTTLAFNGDDLVGYMLWGTEQQPAGLVVQVAELIALSAEGYNALLSSLGTWGSVATSVTLQAVDTHPALALLPGLATPLSVAPYMLRILDLKTAVESRHWNRVNASFCLEIDDPLFASNHGIWKLEANGGGIELNRAGAENDSEAPKVTLSAPGLALWYAGVSRMSELRILRLAHGAELHDSALDALAATSAVHVTEFF